MPDTREQQIREKLLLYEAGMFRIYSKFKRELQIYTEKSMEEIRASNVIEEFERIGEPCPLEEGNTAEMVPINIVYAGRFYGNVSVSNGSASDGRAGITIHIPFDSRGIALDVARRIVGATRD